jgi:hypothetical protein
VEYQFLHTGIHLIDILQSANCIPLLGYIIVMSG